MTIQEVKKAINLKIAEHDGKVYSSETIESYVKPAFFVSVIPTTKERLNQYYELLNVEVNIQYEPLIETEEECLTMADKLDLWFDEGLVVGDRVLHKPEDIEHNIDNNIYLQTTFNLSIPRIVGEDNYDGSTEPLMTDVDTDITFKED